MTTRISLQQIEAAALQGSLLATDAAGDLRYLPPVTPGYILRTIDLGGGEMGVAWADPNFAIGNIYVVPDWATALTLTATWGDDETGDVVKVTADEQYTPPVMKVYIWDGTTLIDITTNPVALADLTDVDTTTVPPVTNDVLQWNGTKWVPGAVSVTNKFTQGGDSFGATAILGTNDNRALQFETNNTTRVTIANDGQWNFNETAGAVNTSAIFRGIAGYASIMRFYSSAGTNAHNFSDSAYTFLNSGVFSTNNGYPTIYGAGGENFTFGIAANNCINIGLAFGTAGTGIAGNRGQVAFVNQGGTYAGGTKDTTIWWNGSAVVAAVGLNGMASFRGRRDRIVTKTANYTVTVNDLQLLGDASAGAFDFTLPTAAAAYDSVLETGNTFDFQKIDASVNAINIKDSGGTILDTMAIQGDKFSFRTNGTIWIKPYN